MTMKHAPVDLADVGPGVAWAFAFEGDGLGRKLPDGAPAVLNPDDGFVWVHLVLANVRSRDWAAAQPEIPPEAKEGLLSAEAHPRIDWAGDALWGAIYDLQRDYPGVSEDTTDVRFVLRPRFLLTLRRHPVSCADTVRKQIEAGAAFGSSAAVFERLLSATADSIGAAAHRIAREIDAIEDRVLSDAASDETSALLTLRRSISRQDRLVHAVLSVLAQLDQPRAEDALPAYCALADRVRQRAASYHADLRLQGERARLLQEEAAAQLAAATNRNLFVLTIVTTVLLPPAFVTGFFGMNTKGLPFGEWENGTSVAAALCLLAALLVFLLIRRFRMLG